MMMPIAEMREFAGFAPAEQRYIKPKLNSVFDKKIVYQ